MKRHRRGGVNNNSNPSSGGSSGRSNSIPAKVNSGAGAKTTNKSGNSSKNNNDSNSTYSNSNSSSGASSTMSKVERKTNHNKYKKPTFNISSISMWTVWKILMGAFCLGVPIVFSYMGYLETRIITQFDNEKMVLRTGLDDPERYWGSYRPLNYFGMKTRDPKSLVMGLMWYSPSNLGREGKGIRHWCDLGDNLARYGWTHHDGRTFGVQEIHDLPYELKTSFVKDTAGKQFGGDWTARVSVRNTTQAWDRTISLIWYIALDESTNGHIKYVSEEKSPEAGVYGETVGLGEFRVRFHPIKGRILHKSYLGTIVSSLSDLKSTVSSHLRIIPDKNGRRFVGLPGEMVSHNGRVPAEPNFIAVQITAEIDFSMDITYQSTSGFSIGAMIPKPPIGREYTNSLQKHIAHFEERFENTFHLNAKGYSTAEIKFAQYALSNMLGGIGYFYGASKVQSVYTSVPVSYWKAALYTAVPSRSFFPRGFLWDEGFHGLLISSWDLDIELDIMCHWFDLLNVEGWIPREMILGVEALAKVPDEFVIQYNTNANPPTFFLTLKKILKYHKKDLSARNRLATLERLYPRLQQWFTWYNTTQKGDDLGTYRWRGRDENSERELNPKTLTSGLDDFPRASHPTDRERHVDLRCWIAFASGVMYELSTLLRKDDVKYYETASFLTDNKLLNDQHLSPYTENYEDWGLHSDSVVLKKPQLPPHAQKYQAHDSEMVRVTLKDPSYEFVDSVYGYVNLFPLALGILDHDSPHLGKILRDIRDPNILWTKFGLRSLSKTSPFYLKYNTEHDPPYWRGPIWININYLVLKALHNYSEIEGPYAEQARKVYNELRENIITNLFKEYQRTGYIYEQYDDTTGRGKGCYPFTGWSSLVVLIMAEQY